MKNRKSRQLLLSVAVVHTNAIKKTGRISHSLRRFVGGNLVMVIGLLMFIIFVVPATVYAHQSIIVSGQNNHLFNQPVVISFGRIVQSNVNLKWEEPVVGSWRLLHTFGGISGAIFTPKTPFVPGSVLHADILNLYPAVDIYSGTKTTQKIKVSIEPPPQLIGQSPAPNAVNLLPSNDISVRLASCNHDLRLLQLKGDLPVGLSPTSSNDETFTWKLKQPLEQGRHYTADLLDLRQTAPNQVIGHFDFQTVTAPQVTNNLSGFIVPGSVVTLNFDKPMRRDTASFHDDLLGSGSWIDDTHYQMTVGAVAPGQSYAFGANKGMTSEDGGYLTDGVLFTAMTPGHVTVIGASPTGSLVSLASQIKLTFDQPVNHTSAEDAFSLSPSADGTFSWSGNSMTFHPTNLQYQTTYTVAIASGITPTFGLPGMAYNFSFTTAYETVKLGVPYYSQMHVLSCEEASLRMVLALYGISTTDDEVLSRVGYAPQPRDTVTNTWQDPYQMFVGNVDGIMNVTGWGAYASAISKAALTFGRSADVVNGPTAQQIAAAIHAGNPVIVWGIIGSTAIDDSWDTTTSGVVHAAKNEHVRVVYGVDGSADNPIGFYIHDPIRSYGNLYWSASKLQTNMNDGGSQAVIVR